MNLKINLDENIYLVQNIAFLMVKIIDKKINIYKKIVTTDNININIKALEKMQNYKLIVNVIVDGKQIFKKFEEFTYKDYDEYIIDNNIRIGKQKNSNFLERVSLINKKNIKNIDV